jgi:hypothetical protein
MAELLASLHLATALHENAFNILSGQRIAEGPTAASLKDANDATGGFAEASGDTADDGVIEWGFCGALDILETTGTIEFVRVIPRAQLINASGAGGSGTVQPYIAHAVRGAPSSIAFGAANFPQDLGTDPADGQPWTPAKINAQHFGWWITAASVDAVSAVDAYVLEFTVEVWGVTSVQAGDVIEVSGSIGAVARAGIIQEEDLDVNFAAEFRRLSPRSYPFATTDGLVTIQAGGGTTVIAPPALEVSTGTVAAGLRNFRAVVIENNLNDTAICDDWPKYIYHARVKLGPAFFPFAANRADARVGVAIGYPHDDFIGVVRPPWPDPSPTTWCSLAYHFEDDSFQLWSTPGNGVDATEKLLMPNPFQSGVPNIVELIYDPVGRAVIAIMGGAERGRITTLTKLPRFDTAGVVSINYSRMATLFCETGAVNGTSVGSNFAICLCWNDDLDKVGVPLW